MGVAVFMRLGDDAMEEVVSSNGGTTIELAYLLAARDEIKSGLEEEANVVLPLVQPGMADGIPVAPVDIQNAAIGGANGGALNDPYLEGEDDAGKVLIFVLFGAVGGVIATECNRMQINSKQGVSVKGTATIYIPELGVELKTTDREDTVARARIWLVIIRIICKMKWEQLGQRNWVLNIKEFFISMISGLSLDPRERRPYQRSVPHLNNIKAHKWATDPKVMGYLLAGNWGVTGVQISTFESSAGASRSMSTMGDDVGRNGGLAKAVLNFMWYLAAFFHECYLGCVMAIVIAIETNEHLYMMHGRLLAYLVDKYIGAVFRAVPMAAHIEIGAVSYSLSGPHQMAAALQAAALQVVLLFGSRDEMRRQKILFDEEVEYHSANAKLILKIQQGSPAQEGGKKKKLAADEDGYGDIGVSFVPGQVGTSPGKKGGKKIDYGGGKEPDKVDLGGRKKSKLCVKYFAGLLKVQDAAGALVRCNKAKGNCNFEHSILKKITADAALKATLLMNDTDLRDRVTATVRSSRSLFKS
jgi:hypothetical protein